MASEGRKRVRNVDCAKYNGTLKQVFGRNQERLRETSE